MEEYHNTSGTLHNEGDLNSSFNTTTIIQRRSFNECLFMIEKCQLCPCKDGTLSYTDHTVPWLRPWLVFILRHCPLLHRDHSIQITLNI